MSLGSVEVQEEGREPRVLKEAPMTDEFALLASPGEIHARVGFSLGTQHDFGRIKVTATVSLECDQHELVINKAGEKAFRKAQELLDDGLRIMVEGDA
jgi:hypothetical protein